jgi:hypothetical protein
VARLVLRDDNGAKVQYVLGAFLPLSGEVMANCPHCGQEIEFVQSGKTSVWTRNLTPGLGCGSLIAIAVIVIVFSRGHSGDIERLDENVRSLERKVETLTNSVNELAKQRKQ